MAQHRRSATSDTELHIDISGAGRTSMLASWTAFFAPGTVVTALPGWNRPRLLVPGGTVRERWKASRMYPAFRWRARLFRLYVRAATALAILPSRTVEAPGWPLQSVLKKYLPETRALSVLVGTPGAGQKLTVECRDEQGRAVGYLKYADGPVAMAQLRNEADMLEVVPAGAGPKLLGCIRWHRGLLLVSRPVAGRPIPATFPPPENLQAFTRALELPERFPLADHPWIRRAQIADILPHAYDALQSREWNRTIQHGDFAAWNVRTDKGELQAFDWEYGNREGFPFLDLAHFVLQHGALIARWTSSRGASVAADYIRTSADDMVLSSDEAAALVQLSAYEAYRNDPSPHDHPLQQWRKSIWRAGQ